MVAKEKAQKGLALLKEAITELLQDYPDGLKCIEIADQLKIRSDYGGGYKDYFSWSILGMLINEKKVTRKGRVYLLNS